MQVARVNYMLGRCQDCGAECTVAYTEIELGRRVGVGVRDGQVQRIVLCTNCTLVLLTQLKLATGAPHRLAITEAALEARRNRTP